MKLKLEVVQGMGERITIRMILNVQAIVSECGCKGAVLRLGLTLGTATCLVAWESENREWFTHRVQGVPFSEASMRGLQGLLLTMHGHIETFPTMPVQLYWLFDVPVGFGPFSSRCRRAVAFVIHMGIFVPN
ncbi:hypothetical protein CRG98_043643 [Punica granatum]|uniref:Uncharacterized protein n=1 Tax=Punica granatum TaxID=22663 RepID=A0A2I0HW89_PUNGR|nr:hypothetical protein CRG98_043643 [Punica granatum]